MRALTVSNAGERQLCSVAKACAEHGEHDFVLRVPFQTYQPMDAVKALARLALVISPHLRTRYDHLRRWLRGEIELPRQILWHTTVSHRPPQQVAIFEHKHDTLETEPAVLLTFENKLLWYPLPPSTDWVRSTFAPITECEEQWSCEFVDPGVIVQGSYTEIKGHFSGTVKVESGD